jgi:ribonucleotide monophosphatase NagD (HAD superfamily)
VVPWRDFDAFLLDLDGVLYLGGAAIPGAAEAVAALRAEGKALRFLTNDPRFSADELAAKLRGLGIPAEPDEILTSGRALARHLQRAGPTGRHGAAFYATGRDAVFPMPDGPWPATGAMLAAVEVAAGRRATVAGKPEPLLFEAALRGFSDRRRVAVVGDTLASDIAGGKKAGCATILVLSGSTRPEDLAASPITPDYVLPSLAALISPAPGLSATR